MQNFNITSTDFIMMNQLTMSIWYHLFLQFLLIPFCLIISSVHGVRDIAHYNVGATVSSLDFTKGLEISRGLTGLKKPFPVPSRSLNSMQENEYTKDAFGENIILPLTEIGGGNFGVKVGFGTPKVDFNLLFDTGSDSSWIQCQPCVSGCDDQLPVFDPSKSQTFSNATCDKNDGCSFTVKYNDGTSSTGYYVNDTLSFTSDDSPRRFVFGCAQNIVGNFPNTSGVLGTGGGKFSLMAQTDPSFFGLFCYCLPASDQDSKGFLVFGAQLVIGGPMGYCPIRDSDKMLSLTVNPNQDGLTQYYVKLIGITIGQKRLDISSIIGSSLDVMIDSGTIITRLPSVLYADLKSEFKNIMSRFPVAKAWDVFDTCYNLDGVKNWTTPQMVMHFENSVDVNLVPSAVTAKKSDSQVCLAFAAKNETSGLNIIGNLQLREHNVLFDTKNQKLDFSVASTGCKM